MLRKRRKRTCFILMGVVLGYFILLGLNERFMTHNKRDYFMHNLAIGWNINESKFNTVYNSLKKRFNEENKLHDEYRMSKSVHSLLGQFIDKHSVDSHNLYNITPAKMMSLPKLTFLPTLKNPCFAVKHPPDNDKGVWVSNNTVIKCWPYFMLIGVEKCASHDIYFRLRMHQHFLLMKDNQGLYKKEPLWYNIRKPNNTLEVYLKWLDDGTRVINAKCPGVFEIRTNIYNQNPKNCPYLLSDFSARTINHNHFWHNETGNENLIVPRYLTADKVYRANPNTKIIITLRNPVDRLLSDYRFYTKTSGVTTPEDFHNRVVEGIKIWNLCISTLGLHEDTCANGYKWPGLEKYYSKIGLFWADNSPDRIRVSIYSIYVNDWLRVFPRENIHIIKMEEYIKHPLHYIENHLLPFIGLEPFSKEAKLKHEKLSQEGRIFNQNSENQFSMWNKTRELLTKFYEPYNRQLADMLGDDTFLWRD